MFEQHELKTWIDQALDIAAVPAGPGVFYAFRDLDERAAFLASRYRRHIAVPRLTRSVDCFENYKLLLQPLMDFFAARGRLPNADELPETATVISALGSLKRAFRLIQNATGAEAWAEVAANRAQDLLIYLALARFDRRPALGQLPLALHRDIRALFQSYAKPASRPTPYSFRLARPKKSMSRVPTRPSARRRPKRFIFTSARSISCRPACASSRVARAHIGRVEGANIVKLSRLEPRISYLTYPGFEEDPRPALAQSLLVHLQTFRVRSRDSAILRSFTAKKPSYLPNIACKASLQG